MCVFSAFVFLVRVRWFGVVVVWSSGDVVGGEVLWCVVVVVAVGCGGVVVW